MTTNPAIRMRQAGPDDVSVLAELLNILDPPGTPLMEAEAGRALLARIARYPDFQVWLAEHGERAVGTYSLLIMDNLCHCGTPSAIVESVAVSVNSRGLGVGRAMMEHARSEARARGCYKLVLSSNEMRTDAHAFYDHLGFRRHGFSFRVDP